MLRGGGGGSGGSRRCIVYLYVRHGSVGQRWLSPEKLISRADTSAKMAPPPAAMLEQAGVLRQIYG